MRFHLSLLLILIALVAWSTAADPDPYTTPQCAVTCGKQASCTSASQSCFCDNTFFENNIQDCILANCTMKEQLISKRLQYRQCDVPIGDTRPPVEAATLVPLIIATVLFVNRVIAKTIHLGGGWGWDDITISIAYVAAIAIYVLNSMMIVHGFGHNIWDIVPLSDITMIYKLFYALVLTYKFQISLAKISVCLFLLRIFSSKIFRRIIFTVIALNAAISVTWICTDAFRCGPIHLAWSGWSAEEPGKCIDFMAATLANSLVNIFVDFAMVMAPIYEIMKLQLTARRKIGVGVMFSMGLLLTIVAIIRVVVFWNNRWSTNQTAQLQPIVHWSVIEVHIAVLCACLPTTRALCAHFFPNIIGGYGKQTYQTGPTALSSGAYPPKSYQKGEIAKTMTYTVNYSSRAQRESSGSSVELVEAAREDAAKEMQGREHGDHRV